MKMLLPMLSALLVLATSSAFAHGGGFDRYGCHNNRRTGDYHCHRSPAPATEAPRGLYRGSPAPSQSRDVVIAAQTLLNHLGCDAGTADGAAGAQTRAAADRFAAAAGREGGIADAGLVRRLAEAVAARERC
jgi:hypothetical protein